jgi:hypothetical protein
MKVKLQTNRLTLLLEGELQDFVEEFSDGRIQFGLVRVKDTNTALPKTVLVGWVSDRFLTCTIVSLTDFGD